MTEGANYLLYDGECPFCTNFSKFYELKKALPNLSIISMRDGQRLKALNLPKDLDFNMGMILVLADGRILQGEPAFKIVNTNIERTSLRDKVVVGVTSIPWISRIVYPMLFRMRKIVLKRKNVPAQLDRVDLAV